MNSCTSDPSYCVLMQGGLQIFYRSNGKFTIQPCTKWNEFPQWELDSVNCDPFQHAKLIELRNTTRQTAQLPNGCTLCRDFDACAGTDKTRTARQAMNQFYHHNYLDLSAPVYDLKGPMYLAIRGDLTCNLACVTCGPELSTKWRLEQNIKGWAVRPDHSELTSLLRNLDKSNLKELHIYGGEPFLGPITPLILNELREYLPNITVWIDTNGTLLPSTELQDLLSLCRRVMIKCSIDAHGRAFEYLRWPAKWSEVEANLLWYNKNFGSNTSLFLRPAIGILNGECMSDLEKWHADNLAHRPDGRPIRIEYNGVYKEFGFARASDQLVASVVGTYTPDHPIIKLIPQTRSDHMTRAFEILCQLDHKRQLKFTDNLPHLAKYFIEHNSINT